MLMCIMPACACVHVLVCIVDGKRDLPSAEEARQRQTGRHPSSRRPRPPSWAAEASAPRPMVEGPGCTHNGEKLRKVVVGKRVVGSPGVQRASSRTPSAVARSWHRTRSENSSG